MQLFQAVYLWKPLLRHRSINPRAARKAGDFDDALLDWLLFLGHCCLLFVGRMLVTAGWGTRFTRPRKQASVTALISDWALYRFYNSIGFTRRDKRMRPLYESPKTPFPILFKIPSYFSRVSSYIKKGLLSVFFL